MRSPSELVPPHRERFLSVDARPRDARHVVLDVVGHVDASTAPLLHACLRTQLSRPGVREVVVDVGGVDVLGAAGVSAIVEAARGCRERGVRFRLRGDGRREVLRPLEVTGALAGPGVELEVAAAPPLAGSVAPA